MRPSLSVAALVAVLLFFSACQDPEWANNFALKAGAPLPEAAQIRDRQTAVFTDTPEERLLVEATQVLQDLGFTVEESAPRYGVLAGRKDRDAHETGQVAGQIALTVGLAVLGVRYNPQWDTDQVIRATIVTHPEGASTTALRISFERIVTTNQGVSRNEELTAPEFSQGFFDEVRAGLARQG